MISQQIIRNASRKNRLAFLARHGEKVVRIVSAEWRAYWRPKGGGYCENVADAGLYTLAEAWERSGHVGKEKGIFYDFVR